VVQIIWDASALVKRYVAEIGSQTANALFMAIPPAQMTTTIMSYSETFAALWRKQNQSILSDAAFSTAQAALGNEVVGNADFVVLGLEFDDILNGIELIERHSLNSTDAAILPAFLRFATPLRASAVSVLVASDRRLLRAAKAEGLEVLDPEMVPAADIPAFLAAL
jgi:predicted nucleic acid-binding protein